MGSAQKERYYGGDLSVFLTNKSVIAFFNQPLEDAVKDCPGNTTNGVGSLLTVDGNRLNVLSLLEISPGLALGHPLCADLDPGLAESLDHLEGINLEDGCCLAGVAKEKHYDRFEKVDLEHLSGPTFSHSAWSSRPLVLNSIPPQVITPAVRV